MLASATEHFLRDAGIVSGMRVLDIGCGMGDVTMLVAQLVGAQGRVTSIDLDQASIATARKRAAAVGLDNTTFHRVDISTFTDIEPFDAIVGRLVLEFLPDPAATIRRLCGLLVVRYENSVAPARPEPTTDQEREQWRAPSDRPEPPLRG